MQTPYGHLSYCSNIHPGEVWEEHFAELQKNVPLVKEKVSLNAVMGMGLRIANQASIDLQNATVFQELKNWLTREDLYVFTLNGFPYGGFHDTIVKDQVHSPDWTTQNRFDYTVRLAHLLSDLLPDGIQEGGISTSPLSYKYWWKTSEGLQIAKEKSTIALLDLVLELIEIESKTGKWIHIDIEPEPDGILENHAEFISWYEEILVPLGLRHLQKNGISNPESFIKRHIQLCFDICHYGVSYDDPKKCIEELNRKGISVGKIQISSAIRVQLNENSDQKIENLKKYHESVYLHQVKAKLANQDSFIQYRDLDEAIEDFKPGKFDEWRVHFHVPLFLENYGLLGSTQQVIKDTLEIQKLSPCTNHLEIETYTWAVLPQEHQVPIHESIIREMEWVKNILHL